MTVVAEAKHETGLYHQLKNKIDSMTASVGVIGLGYVGLPFLVEKAKVGLSVFGFDRCQNLINSLVNKKSYIDDPYSY